MRCRLCGSELAYIHGHGACIDNRCPMFGLNQAECCDGETAANCPALAELSEAEKAKRKPLPPEELFDAKSERVHREPGRARAARTVRNKRRVSS